MVVPEVVVLVLAVVVVVVVEVVAVVVVLCGSNGTNSIGDFNTRSSSYCGCNHEE